MKNATIIIIILVAVMMMLTSCSTVNPIDRISKNNDITNLIENHTTVSVKLSYLNMEGYEDTSYSMTARSTDGDIEILDFSEENRILLFSKGILYILENDKDFYTVLMSDLVYETYISDYLQNIDYYNNANYKFISKKKENNILEVIYSFEINDILIEDFSIWGLGKGETILVEYFLSDNWQLDKQVFILEVKKGEDKILLSKEYRYNLEFSDEKLDHYINSEDNVVITVIEKNDNNQKKVEYMIPRNSYFGYDFSDTGSNLYFDYECTRLFRYSEAVIQDITLFFK